MSCLHKRVDLLLSIVSLPIGFLEVAKAQHPDPSKPTVAQPQSEIGELRIEMHGLKSLAQTPPASVDKTEAVWERPQQSMRMLKDS
jgi:hypothetical protein